VKNYFLKIKKKFNKFLNKIYFKKQQLLYSETSPEAFSTACTFDPEALGLLWWIHASHLPDSTLVNNASFHLQLENGYGSSPSS
jgi:hypothetical protein